MIRPYLEYIEIIKMISSRLTKTQKDQILEAYRAGDSTNLLAEKYSCSTNTINRTVKSLLSDSEYKLLKRKRSKISNKKGKIVNDEIYKGKNQEVDISDVDETASFPLQDTNALNEDLYSVNQDDISHEVDNNNQDVGQSFELIEPLLSCFDFNHDKQKVDFEILNYETLPESVYMIVDKKVELDLKLISDLPEWNFLPVDELQRNAILLFSNQRSAKRICSRNQRVIKIPNTSVFGLSKSYLIQKGITRLILEDSIIALDN